MTKKVAVFLNQHMPMSEVFVAHQVGAYQNYTPTLIACRQVTPSVAHSFPTHILNKTNSFPEKIKETVFKLTGRSPFLEKHISSNDIIHAHFGPTGWLATPLSHRTNIPLVVTLHGFDVLKNSITFKDDGMMQVLYKKYLERLTQRASKFICVSEYLKSRAIEFGFPSEKCVVNYMGIPLTPHITPKYIRQNTSESFRILSVGRLVPMKGHHLLIDVVALVEARGYHIKLDIVGAGPLHTDLEQHAKSKLKNYKFWGAQPHEKILSLMRQSDIFCHLSHQTENGYNEAFGLVVLEAQWAGLPVVAFQSGGVPEGIDNGKTGILCPENDVASVAESICNLIDNDNLRNQMSNTAPEFVRKNFDNAKLTTKLELIYDDVLQGGKHR